MAIIDFFHSLRLFTRMRLIRQIRKDFKYRTTSHQMAERGLRKLKAKQAVVFNAILKSLPAHTEDNTRFFSSTALMEITLTGNHPELTYRAVADHYHYVLESGVSNAPAAIALISRAITEHGLTAQQERALIRLEISRIQSVSESHDPRCWTLRHYGTDISDVVRERPADIEQIITIMHSNPSVIRRAELEAFLNGDTITPLMGGAL